MTRYAAIDVGTNSVLLLVAELQDDGRWVALRERAEITRLGRGVDQTRQLSESSMNDTVRVLEAYAAEARGLAVTAVAGSATSAARDASNGAAFLERVRERTGIHLEILSGDEEARLSFQSVALDASVSNVSGPLVVIDIGGGSTEFVYGGEGGVAVAGNQVSWRRSFDIGSVRLTERCVHSDPPTPVERAAATKQIQEALSALPAPPSGARVFGVAGTVTTLFAIAHEVEPYDSARVHGGVLDLATLRALTDRLFAESLEARKHLKGLQPKRADVIPLGALILTLALERLGAERCTVSDRGLRWGLLLDRFGPEVLARETRG